MPGDFDAVLNLESNLIAEGRTCGFDHGRKEGFREGYDYGVAEARQLGAELALCDGRTAMLLAVYEQRPHLCSDRMRKTLHAARSLLSQLKIDADDDKCVEQVNDLRAKMRMIDIMLRPLGHAQPTSANTALDF
mmetsp:Transcript_35533/g.82966  ORF Transcript_35533/g.82966 Transcript_35533/m.82966 type:complete len:134 (-) Transcript_35533:384-785(-)